jgi:hypothetical protein
MHLGVGSSFKILYGYYMFCLVQAIFVVVKAGPKTLSSWDLVKQQLGLPVGAGDPMHSSRHKSKNRYRTAWDFINLESLPISSVVVFWICDILVWIRTTD